MLEVLAPGDILIRQEDSDLLNEVFIELLDIRRYIAGILCLTYSFSEVYFEEAKGDSGIISG